VFPSLTLCRNYYFSVENLCKDLYLRKHMDSQGFVFLELLAKFNRIKQLTSDMDLIRQACLHSQTIEYVHVEGVDRVRAREGWQQWILKMNDRDASAQNVGPSLQAPPQYPHSTNYIPTFEDRQSLSPRPNALGNPMGIQYHSLNGVTPSSDQGHPTAGWNTLDASVTRTPLSAAVSEFSPSVRSDNRRNPSTPDAHSQSTSVFTDAQVENLHILVRKPMNAAASMPPPFHSSSSRTFSNGSIDGRSIHAELSKSAERQSRPVGNGDASER
jgi:la-related protein 1